MALQIIKGKTGDWEVIIGLEVHAQIVSSSKLFSNAGTDFGAEPNTQVSYVDAAMPGMLPTLNKKCVEQAVKTGLGLNAKINLCSAFDRKNYFYPDLPQGYQISQFFYPIVGRGDVEIVTQDSAVRNVGITRIHIEQDAGKSIHDAALGCTLIDLNRAGIGLMEIVTEPDMRSSEEAAEFMKKLRSILRYLGTCDGDMEKGSMRCDANISVRTVGNKNLGIRVEVKNVNSIKNLVKAINFEASRQVELIEDGCIVVQETRLFDAESAKTRTMRLKEDTVDYRYFPDPDLLPLILTEEYVESIKKNLPELPDAKKARYISEMGISEYDAAVLVADKAVAEYFENVAKSADPKTSANWIVAELFAKLNKSGLDIQDSPVSAQGLAALINLISQDVISGKIAKQVFDIMFEVGGDPLDIVKEKNLVQVTNTSEIALFIDQIIADNPSEVAAYKAGKEKLFGFLVGKVMQISKGKANPSIVNDLLKQKLAD